MRWSRYALRYSIRLSCNEQHWSRCGDSPSKQNSSKMPIDRTNCAVMWAASKIKALHCLMVSTQIYNYKWMNTFYSIPIPMECHMKVHNFSHSICVAFHLNTILLMININCCLLCIQTILRLQQQNSHTKTWDSKINKYEKNMFSMNTDSNYRWIQLFMWIFAFDTQNAECQRSYSLTFMYVCRITNSKQEIWINTIFQRRFLVLFSTHKKYQILRRNNIIILYYWI